MLLTFLFGQKLRVVAAFLVALAVPVMLVRTESAWADNPPIDEQGTIRVPSFLLPESSLLTDETRAALKHARQAEDGLVAGFAAISKACPAAESEDPPAMRKVRHCAAEAFYQTRFYKAIRARYSVMMTRQLIDGVSTEIFTPKEGVAPKNKDRVLINLHGGHFMDGSRTVSHVESISIASVGKIKVISIDYRLAPEYAFPAASEDVAAVYREVLKSHRPQNIGFFGCSSGALLIAQSMALFQKEALPLPAAIGMFCGGASYYQDGDSGVLASAREGFGLLPPPQHPYFKAVSAEDPLAFPIRSSQTMAKFPPSLLIAATRDLGMSSAVHTHSELTRLGVQADLHVWEGMAHCFFGDPDLPQTREVNAVVSRFFDRHLGH